MLYKKFQDKSLSALGFGAMRLPKTGADDSVIDEKTAREMIDLAMDRGINYYDTAWGYHGGNSEIFIGNALAKYPRDAYFLASKFPGYVLSNMAKIEEIFEKQLEKCGVSFFDFYLFHNVCEMNIDAYLDKKFGLFAYLMKQKETGRIRHLGFSTHGSNETARRFLEAFGTDMEFCQIQLNWLDWKLQDAKGKVDLLAEYKIPIWVMEPLRGGKLASLAPDQTEKLKAMRPAESGAAWAFRFLQSIPSVTVVLSGMSTPEQLKENIAVFAEDAPLKGEETAALLSIADGVIESKTLPCTKCRYCIDHCPQKLDIPWLLELYNEHCFSNGGFIAPMAMMALEPEKQPKACIACRSCEAVCPQQIKISGAMADFAKKLEG